MTGLFCFLKFHYFFHNSDFIKKVKKCNSYIFVSPKSLVNNNNNNTNNINNNNNNNSNNNINDNNNNNNNN